MWGLLSGVDWEPVGKLAAVLSALFSAYAAYNSRRLVVSMISSHRQAIRPIAQIVYGDYDDRLYVRFENRGLGPMVIEKMQVLRDGRDIGSGALVYAEDFPFVEEYVDDFIRDLQGLVVRQGGKIILFRAKGEIEDAQFQEYLTDLRKYISQVEFIIFYKDLYDQAQAPARRSGDWFGRHFKQVPATRIEALQDGPKAER